MTDQERWESFWANYHERNRDDDVAEFSRHLAETRREEWQRLITLLSVQSFLGTSKAVETLRDNPPNGSVPGVAPEPETFGIEEALRLAKQGVKVRYENWCEGDWMACCHDGKRRLWNHDEGIYHDLDNEPAEFSIDEVLGRWTRYHEPTPEPTQETCGNCRYAIAVTQKLTRCQLRRIEDMHYITFADDVDKTDPCHHPESEWRAKQ